MIRANKVLVMTALAVLLIGITAWAQTSTGNPIAPATGGVVTRAEPVSQGTTPVAVGATSPQAAQPAADPEHAPEILIGGGDLLEVSVYGAPDFEKKEVRVSGSGDIVLPLIGTQHVQGLTPAQAQALIAGKLSKGEYFNNPQVAVFVKEYATGAMSVLGEVQKPGTYPLLGPRRLFDVISQAGGLTPKAGKVIILQHRATPDKPERIMLDRDLENSSGANVPVQPGDTVLVSKAGIVYVVGDVKLPGGFIMDNGRLTVLQAIALAQGTNPTAKLDAAKLIRSVDNKPQEMPIALSKIMSSKDPDLTLQPDDIVFVPHSAAKSATRRGLEAILQTATGLAIYRP